MTIPLSATPRIGAAAIIGLGSLVAFTTGFTLWSATVPLAEASIAAGQVKAEGSRRVVQHFEGGIVADILVRDGDRVKAGDPLLRLEAVQSSASRDNLLASVWSLSAQLARLEAEAANAHRITFGEDLMAEPDARAVSAMENQKALFDAREGSFDIRRQVIETRLSQHAASIASTAALRSGQQTQLKLLREEEADARQLLQKGLERASQFRALQRQIAAVETNLLDLAARSDAAIAEKAQTEGELESLRRERISAAKAEAVETRVRLEDARQRLNAASDIAARRQVVAPEDGIVIASRFFNSGAVVRPGETVLEIVPENDRLLAEVRVAPTDIDSVHAGLAAEIRLPGYKQRVVPTLSGKVILVDGDLTQEPATGAAFYKACILIDPAQITALQAVELKAGMPVEAMIKTGERSFLRYLAQPFLDSFNRAFREA